MRWGVAGLFVLAVASGSPALAQDCVDPETPDCDDDGFAPPTDCDDDDPAINPDAAEVCNNSADDDCDDVVDDDCYEEFQDGALEGGTTCEGHESGWAVMLLVPPFVGRRRRR